MKFAVVGIGLLIAAVGLRFLTKEREIPPHFLHNKVSFFLESAEQNRADRGQGGRDTDANITHFSQVEIIPDLISPDIGNQSVIE